MSARIYQEGKNAMQSGRARAGTWVLEHEPREGKRADPLTGWAGSGDTQTQVKLRFESQAAAIAYAHEQGLNYHLVPAQNRTLKIQAYADNFGRDPIEL